MTREHAERYIREQKGHTRSVDDQVQISHAMWDHGLTGGPSQSLMERALVDKLDLDLEYLLRTSLDHLLEIDVVFEVVEAEQDWYHICGWTYEIIWGRIDEYAHAGVEALIDHMQDDDREVADGGRESIREVLAREFGIGPEGVEAYLRIGRDQEIAWGQMDPLNTAVKAIEAHPEIEKRDDYGEIIIERGHYRYQLSEAQVDRYEREEE